MITDGNVFVVGQQRIVGTEQLADARGVIDRGVKVRVVSNLRGKLHLRFLHGHQERSYAILRLGDGPGFVEQRSEPAAQWPPRHGSKPHERVEPLRAARGPGLL